MQGETQKRDHEGSAYSIPPFTLVNGVFVMDKLVKIGAKAVRDARYAIFQRANVAVPRELFEKTL